ncbi:MAG: Zn-ribbon domain-containing OB-fold protein [Candidatus Binatia bacterium]
MPAMAAGIAAGQRETETQGVLASERVTHLQSRGNLGDHVQRSVMGAGSTSEASIGHRQPLPQPTRDNLSFYEAARRGELRFQKCSACGGFRHYPRPVCPSSPLKNRHRSEGKRFCVRSRRRTGGKSGDFVEDSATQSWRKIATRSRGPVFQRAARCLSRVYSWERSTGRGCVYTWTIVRGPTLPALQHKVPYNVVDVLMDEGVHFISEVLDCSPEEITAGMPVEAVFVPMHEGITLVKFRRVQ